MTADLTLPALRETPLQGEIPFQKEEYTLRRERLTVAISMFEGPLDILSALAKAQKVDMRDVSVSELADQYIAFIEQVKSYRIELAAEYLVTAAGLVYLKSCLILPRQIICEEAISAEEAAKRLRFRLLRLETVRAATDLLFGLPQKKIDFYERGEIEDLQAETKIEYGVSLYDLLSAYGELKVKTFRKTYAPSPPDVYSSQDALNYLIGYRGALREWSSLSALFPPSERKLTGSSVRRRSVIAGLFVACLENVKNGVFQIRQESPFAELEIRRL